MTTQLTVVERAAVALGATALEVHLQDLAAKHKDITAIANKAGRDQVHSAAMAIRTQRTDIEKTGKAARDDANAFAKAVIAEEKRLIGIIEPEEKRLITLRDAWDEARAAEKRAAEEKKTARKAHIQSLLDGIRNAALLTPGDSSASIRETIDAVEKLALSESDYQEFLPAAERAKREALELLSAALKRTVEHEEEQASIKAAQKAEAARLAAERAELDRRHAEEAAKLAAERAELDRLRAEADALRKAEEERAAQAKAEADAKLAAERAELARQAEEIRARQAAIDLAARNAKAEAEAAERQAAAEKARLEREEAERAEAKRQADEAERRRIARENSPPSATDVIALVANTYGVSQSAALGWLNGMFGIKPRSNGD